jgi:hypothetical protein
LAFARGGFGYPCVFERAPGTLWILSEHSGMRRQARENDLVQAANAQR